MATRRILLGLLTVLAMLAGAQATAGQVATCDDYTSQTTAQFALDLNPERHAAELDPDGNGIACDHTGSSAAPSPTPPPPPSAPSPTPAGGTDSGGSDGVTIDVIDQQPVDSVAPTAAVTPTPTGAATLDGRLGGTREAFETTHGAPIETIPSEDIPSLALYVYEPPATASDLYTIVLNEQVAIVVVEATSAWDTTAAAAIIAPYLPDDVTELPVPERLADGSLLLPTYSAELATGIREATLQRAGIPGVPGDLYLLLFTDATGQVVQLEAGIGNGDDVREAAAS